MVLIRHCLPHPHENRGDRISETESQKENLSNFYLQNKRWRTFFYVSFSDLCLCLCLCLCLPFFLFPVISLVPSFSQNKISFWPKSSVILSIFFSNQQSFFSFAHWSLVFLFANLREKKSEIQQRLPLVIMPF